MLCEGSLVSVATSSPARNEAREAQALQIVRDLIAQARCTPYGIITVKIPIEASILQEPCGELVIRVRPPRE